MKLETCVPNEVPIWIQAACVRSTVGNSTSATFAIGEDVDGQCQEEWPCSPAERVIATAITVPYRGVYRRDCSELTTLCEGVYNCQAKVRNGAVLAGAAQSQSISTATERWRRVTE